MADHQINSSAKRKVAHLSSAHPIEDVRILHKECLSLARNGYEVTYIAPADKAPDIQNITFRTLAKAEGRFGRFLLTTTRVLTAAIKEKADIYHFHDPDLIHVGLILKLLGKKVIYDVHEDMPRNILSKYWLPVWLRKAIANAFEPYENVAARLFDAVVAATPHITKRFGKLGCNAINVNNYPYTAELTVVEASSAQKEKAVCYIGSITKVRGIIEMVEAIGMTDAKLLLAGAFSPVGLRAEMVQYAEWSKVEYAGVLKREDVAKLLSRAMAGLVVLHYTPAFEHALATKMFEYMMAGIPVISSNFALWCQIVEENQCGICVDPSSPQEIAAAINWLLEHPEEAVTMGNNGRKAVLEKYNWAVEEATLLELYKTIQQ